MSHDDTPLTKADLAALTAEIDTVPLVLDYVRALREPMYRRELSKKLETDVTEMIMLEAADVIERMEALVEGMQESVDTRSEEEKTRQMRAVLDHVWR